MSLPVRPPQNIVVRGVNWLGDAVMSTPALDRLREALPQARITLLTPAKLSELWLHHPAVDEVIAFTDRDRIWRTVRRLRASRFELGLILPNSPRSALELWLAGIPQRIGYARPWRNWCLTRPIPFPSCFVTMRKRSDAEIHRAIQASAVALLQPIPDKAHHIYHYLHLVSTLGASAEPLPPCLHVRPEEVDAVTRKFNLSSLATTAQPWFGLNAGAEYGPAKRWPIERFVAAAAAIHQQTRCLWLILGGRNDLALGNELTAKIQHECSTRSNSQPVALNLAGATTLRELCAVLKACRVLLTNDTGPMHVAAALGTPVVVPFGSTSPELTGPGLPGDPKHRLLRVGVPCSPCFRRVCPIDFRCMHGLGVDPVVEAVMAIYRLIPQSQ